MATRNRRTTQWREKSSSATSSSSSNPTRSIGKSNATFANATSEPSSDKEKVKPEKPLPNYLRPTMSSRNESFKPVKKSSTREQDQKFLRRRSFDIRQLSSSSSRIPKELASPAHRESIGPVPHERKSIARSTSYNSSKTNPSAAKMGSYSRNTTSTTTTKGGAAVKPQPARSQSVKKSSTKRNVSPSVEDHASSSHDTTTQENEAKEENNESGVQEVEEIDKADREVGVLSDVPKPEAVEVKNNDEEDDDEKSYGISTVSESDILVQPEAAAASEIEEKALEEEKSNEVGEVPGQETSEEDARAVEESTGNSTTFPEENAETENVEDQKVADDDNNKKYNRSEDQLGSSEEAAGDQEKEQQGEEEDEEEQVQEGNNDDDDEEKTKTKREKAPVNLVNTLKRQEQAQGKKESPAAYNDVIEETASKLLEKRKNKVKALVGAFETVIDYESASAPK